MTATMHSNTYVDDNVYNRENVEDDDDDNKDAVHFNLYGYLDLFFSIYDDKDDKNDDDHDEHVIINHKVYSLCYLYNTQDYKHCCTKL
jgi:hypothetical protein